MLDLAGEALKNRITMIIAKTSPMILTITISVRALASSVGMSYSYNGGKSKIEMED